MGFAKRRRPRKGPSRNGCGRIAQLVEQLTLNQRVLGSSPSAPTNQNQSVSLGLVVTILEWIVKFAVCFAIFVLQTFH